jgi:hypothetical protein
MHRTVRQARVVLVLLTGSHSCWHSLWVWLASPTDPSSLGMIAVAAALATRAWGCRLLARRVPRGTVLELDLTRPLCLRQSPHHARASRKADPSPGGRALGARQARDPAADRSPARVQERENRLTETGFTPRTAKLQHSSFPRLSNSSSTGSRRATRLMWNGSARLWTQGQSWAARPLRCLIDRLA